MHSYLLYTTTWPHAPLLIILPEKASLPFLTNHCSFIVHFVYFTEPLKPGSNFCSRPQKLLWNDLVIILKFSFNSASTKGHYPHHAQYVQYVYLCVTLVLVPLIASFTAGILLTLIWIPFSGHGCWWALRVCAGLLPQSFWAPPDPVQRYRLTRIRQMIRGHTLNTTSDI